MYCHWGLFSKLSFPYCIQSLFQYKAIDQGPGGLKVFGLQ